MIGCLNCPITGVRLQPNVRLQLYRVISELKYKAADAAITFEEIVMIVIKLVLTHDLLEDRRINGVIIHKLFFFNLLY